MYISKGQKKKTKAVAAPAVDADAAAYRQL
jgi:hypothetical protein